MPVNGRAGARSVPGWLYSSKQQKKKEKKKKRARLSGFIVTAEKSNAWYMSGFPPSEVGSPWAFARSCDLVVEQMRGQPCSENRGASSSSLVFHLPHESRAVCLWPLSLWDSTLSAGESVLSISWAPSPSFAYSPDRVFFAALACQSDFLELRLSSSFGISCHVLAWSRAPVSVCQNSSSWYRSSFCTMKALRVLNGKWMQMAVCAMMLELSLCVLTESLKSGKSSWSTSVMEQPFTLLCQARD